MSSDKSTNQIIIDTFKKFDTNNDGSISKDELTRVLKVVSGNAFSDAQVDTILIASDTNKDGVIQYEEFVNWVTKDLEFKPLDKRGDFKVDYRKLLPERFEVDIAKRYDLDKSEIGAGGFGSVFVAKDLEFGSRQVAVKKVRKPTGRSDSALSDLQQEIAVMKELDHPNICKLLATFEEGRHMYFVMELCEGGEVFDRIIETGSVTPTTTANIVGQVCSALKYAHDRTVCHRDIKPENVVFCSKDRNDLSVKLIDWGLATHFNEQHMTKAVGSMTYAAPEVIDSRDKKAYTEKCDIWSTGVLTYVMLCGKPPFWGNRDSHLRAAKGERYPFDDAPWDRMDPRAKDFIRKSLKAKPDSRASITDLVQHPWLRDQEEKNSGSDEVNSAVIGNLKNFSNKNTFSRMCITAVARQLDHHHLKDIHQVFRAMDKNGDGVLSLEEVKDGMKELGSDAAEKLFQSLDMDGSAKIDYTEFCAAALDQKQETQDDVIWAAFKTFDLNNNGQISVDDLATILDSSDIQDIWTPGCCREVSQEIMSKFDKDGDGMISFDDWKGLMTQCWEKSKTETEGTGGGMGAYDLLLKVNNL